VQTSATSHTPAETRQVVPAATTASAGQEEEEPVQVSATSQPPATAARQTVELATKTSEGQVPVEPVQVSATSHTPDETRQTVPAGMNISVGQVFDTPSHSS
jgi:hypothetical protein